MDSLTHCLMALSPAWLVLVKLTALLCVAWMLHLALYRCNPRWRVLLWRSALTGSVMVAVLALLTPGIGVAVPIPADSGSPASPSDMPRDSVVGATGDVPGDNSYATDWADEQNPAVATVAIEPPAVTDRAVDDPIGGRAVNLRILLMVGWVVGASILVGRWLVAWAGVRRMVATSLPVAEAVQRHLRSVAADLGCTFPVEVRYSPLASSPLLAGLRRAVIILPQGMTEKEHDEDLPAIFTHELTHLQSKDLQWMVLMQWTILLFWFHPLTWTMRKAHDVACEAVCDASAAEYVGDSGAYSRLLARVALALLGRPPAAGAIAMAQRPEIMARLANLRRGLHARPLACWRTAPAVVTSLVIVLALGSFKLVQAKPAAGTGSPSTTEEPGRVVHFPTGRSLGRLLIRDKNTQHRIDTFYYYGHAGWEIFGQARGDVVVPAGKELMLAVFFREAVQDLSPLGELRPDDLHTLLLGGETPADNKCMRHVAHLTGLKTLNLNSTDITDRGMQFVRKLRELEYLTPPPQFGDAGMSYIASLPSLKGLYLKGTSVTNKGLAHLEQMPQLEEMELGGQRMDDGGLVHLAKLPKLQYLKIYGATLTDEGLAHIANVPSLRILAVFRMNHITDAGLAHLAKLPRLEHLSLNGTGVTDAGMIYLKAFPALKKLDVGGTGVTEAGVAQLGRIQSLEDLRLPDLTDQGLAHLIQLAKLKYLRIGGSSRSPIGDAGLAHVARLGSLEELKLGGTGITDAGMAQIAKLARLKRLALFTAPGVTNEGLARLTALKNLESLYFRRTKITTSGLNVLNALPQMTELMAHGLGQDDRVMDLSGLMQLEKLTLVVTSSDHFRNEDLACLAKLTRLKWLTISRVGGSSEGISNAGMAHLAGLTAMQRLSIGGSGVTDAGLVHLTHMPLLNHLMVRGTFTDAGLRYLERINMLGYLNLMGEHDFTPTALQHLQQQRPGLMIVGVDIGGARNTAKGFYWRRAKGESPLIRSTEDH